MNKPKQSHGCEIPKNQRHMNIFINNLYFAWKAGFPHTFLFSFFDTKLGEWSEYYQAETFPSLYFF